MNTQIAIPTKPFWAGKSRLSGFLSDHERRQLNEYLFLKTLRIAMRVVVKESLHVISKDPEVLTIVNQMGAVACKEEGEGGLNQALYQINNHLDKKRDTIMVLPTDLPLLCPEDIHSLLNQLTKLPQVLVVPDRHWLGTNVLVVSPVGAIPYRFGNRSFSKHVNAANKREIPVRVLTPENLVVDLDVVEDLEILRSRGYIIPLQAINTMKETVK